VSEDVLPAGVGELLDRFTDPGPQYGPLPLWWWSGARVTRERLRRQMEQLIAGGVRQAVVREGSDSAHAAARRAHGPTRAPSQPDSRTLTARLAHPHSPTRRVGGGR
jgi:hypothetical protein